jgi:hypothetical protein
MDGHQVIQVMNTLSFDQALGPLGQVRISALLTVVLKQVEAEAPMSIWDMSAWT